MRAPHSKSPRNPTSDYLYIKVSSRKNDHSVQHVVPHQTGNLSVIDKELLQESLAFCPFPDDPPDGADHPYPDHRLKVPFPVGIPLPLFGYFELVSRLRDYLSRIVRKVARTFQ